MNELEAPKVQLSINPLPKDGKCNCCGKHINNLRAFDKSDEFVNGAKLVKNFRTMAMPVIDERYIKIEKEYAEKDYEGFEEALFEIFAGSTETMLLRAHLSDTIEASWECRDCFILDDKDYFKTKFGDLE